MPTKVHLVKAMIFPEVMYRLESWTIKKADCQRIDAFELWCWRRLLRVPWIARRSIQSVLKEINPEYSLERLLLKPKLQYFVHLIGEANLLEKTLMLGRIEDKKKRGWQSQRGFSDWTIVICLTASPTRLAILLFCFFFFPSSWTFLFHETQQYWN